MSQSFPLSPIKSYPMVSNANTHLHHKLNAKTLTISENALSWHLCTQLMFIYFFFKKFQNFHVKRIDVS